MSDFTNEAIQVTRRLEEISELLANGDLGRNAEDDLYYERAELEGKDRYLSAYFDVVNKNEKLQQQNAELVARVGRLEQFIFELTCRSGLPEYVADTCEKLLNETPQQSLAEIQAEALSEAAELLYQDGWNTPYGDFVLRTDLEEYADRLRQQTNRGSD